MTMSMLFILVSSHHQFQVGGENGWQKPTSSNFTAAQETYNQWATINRFLIGDTLCKHPIYIYILLFFLYFLYIDYRPLKVFNVIKSLDSIT